MMSTDSYGRPLGTAPGEAFGPQPETFFQRHARVIAWAEDIAAVVCGVGAILYVTAYLVGAI